MTQDSTGLKLDEFDYELPEELIAQEPMPERDQSRLLIYNRNDDSIDHRSFSELANVLSPTDVLVINDSKVIPARLRGRKNHSDGAVEILLIHEVSENCWWVMLKPGRRVRPGTIVRLHTTNNETTEIQFKVVEKNDEGHCLVTFEGTDNILNELDELGEIPLPPYIEAACHRDYDDKHRYQTVYAAQQGSVAAPTAGLHFSPQLLASLESKGIEIVRVTLHVGLGTFAPVKAEKIVDHQMHHEHFEISESAATALNQCKDQGRRIIAVGTTSVRVLETAAANNTGQIKAQKGRTNIFIYPPYEFRFIDSLITNFHLPKSSLLMLISAMAAPGQLNGIESIREVYSNAIEQRYRFFSYGDAMLIQ